jgi:hypothetical protein
MKTGVAIGGLMVAGVAASAQAYIGPGVGITMIGWFAGFAVVVGAALWAVMRLPFQWLMGRLRGADRRAATEAVEKEPPDTVGP